MISHHFPTLLPFARSEPPISFSVHGRLDTLLSKAAELRVGKHHLKHGTLVNNVLKTLLYTFVSDSKDFPSRLATARCLSLLSFPFACRRDAIFQSSCYRPPGSIPDESSPLPSQCHPPGSKNSLVISDQIQQKSHGMCRMA